MHIIFNQLTRCFHALLCYGNFLSIVATAVNSLEARSLKLKLLRGPHEGVRGNPRAALWRWRNNSGTWTY